jgi:hypothetical protein
MANPPSKSKTKESIPRYRCYAKLFGSSPLLVREDAANYDELFARFRAAVKPVDIFGAMFIADLAALECDILSFRDLKSALINVCQVEAIRKFLLRNLNHSSYLTHKAAERIFDKARRWPPKTAEEAAEITACATERFMERLDLSIARKYLQGEPKAVAVVNKLLAKHHTHIEAVTAEERTNKLPEIAQIDRLIEGAERRRSAILREIDRHNARLAETLRRTVQEVEDAEYQFAETPLSGKH